MAALAPELARGRRHSLFGTTDVPQTEVTGDPDHDGAVRFVSAIPGRIVGMRFFKEEHDTVPHVGRIWDSNRPGGHIGRIEFEDETPQGWQYAYFPQPIRVDAGRSYAASVNNSGPHFVSMNFFRGGFANGPLNVPQHGGARFPSGDRLPAAWTLNNFWVDIILEEILVQRPRSVPVPSPRILDDSGVDIRLVQDARFPMQGVAIDWSLRPDGTLDDTQSLATAMIVALGTDRRADLNEQLPDPDSADRRGWWGDLDADVIWNGWPIGCKLWLFKREKITSGAAWQGATTVRIERYIREAVQPFLEPRLRVGSQMEIYVHRVSEERIDALVRLYRGPVTEIELRYSVLWSDIMRSGGSYDIGGGRREI